MAVRVAMVGLLVGLLPAGAWGGPGGQGSGGVEVAGIFVVGVPIRGAVLSEQHLYVTTTNRLSIFDVSDPIDPTLLSSVSSPRPIHGELLPTNGQTLLLNGSSLGGTVDVWDVEDKSNPVLVSTIRSMPDEHVACLLNCRWVYGSDGSIVDLRRRGQPTKRRENWKTITGVGAAVHRVDEFRPGRIVTAPRSGSPVVIDARKPLRPRIVAKTDYEREQSNGFLYSHWPAQGDGRYLFSSVEFPGSRDCRNPGEGALLAFDTKGWPRRSEFPLAGRFRIGEGSNGHDCNGYYFSLHPAFPKNGLMVLPYGSEGTRVVRVGKRGSMKEEGSFTSPLSEVWLSFWVDEEIFYALNLTGEVYILRYRD